MSAADLTLCACMVALSGREQCGGDEQQRPKMTMRIAPQGEVVLQEAELLRTSFIVFKSICGDSSAYLPIIRWNPKPRTPRHRRFDLSATPVGVGGAPFTLA
jgi:hypothetical protein